MKKRIGGMLAAVLVLALAGCGSRETGKEAERSGQGAEASQEAGTKTETGAETEAPVTGEAVPEAEAGNSPESKADTAGQAEGGNKALVVYFSWSGNTKQVANAIREQTGADLFEIVPEEAYTDDYDALLDIAAEEKQNGARPAIEGSVENMDQYETVYVGFPNWWSDMPMILYTFFDEYDLSGKTVAPFCTSGGSGFSDTLASIRELEPDAEVLEGLHIAGSSASDPDEAVKAWLEGLADI